MKSNRYSTYEDAVRDYLDRFRALMQHSQKEIAGTARGVIDLPGEELLQRSEEVAGLSSEIFHHAQAYLSSAVPSTREGIRFHFIDQATIEMLLGIELLQISEEKAAGAPNAAVRATHGAALSEAMSAVEKSSSVPVAQGLPVPPSNRVSESATIDEALAGLKLAAESAVSNICHRVQELGGDIAFDLVSGMQWDEVSRGASLPLEEISAALQELSKQPIGELLDELGVRSLVKEGVRAQALPLVREFLRSPHVPQ